VRPVVHLEHLADDARVAAVAALGAPSVTLLERGGKATPHPSKVRLSTVADETTAGKLERMKALGVPMPLDNTATMRGPISASAFE
jgi:hypothetical protein